MAVTKVQDQHASGTSVNSSLTISAAGAGNLLVAMFHSLGPKSGITDPAGYTRVSETDFDTGAACVYLLWKIAAGGETSIAFTHASQIWQISAAEFNDSAARTWQFDAQDHRDVGAGVHVAQCTTGVTPATADDVFVVAAAQNGNNGGSEAVDSGFTALGTAVTGRSEFGTKIKAGDSTAENPTVSWSTNRTAGIVLAAFKLAAAAATTLPERHMPRGVERGLIRGVT